MTLEEEIQQRLKEEGILVKTPDNGNQKLGLFLEYYRKFLFNFLPDRHPFFDIRNKIMGFGHFGQKCMLRSGFRCSHPENVYLIGDLFVNYSCTFLANREIVIGRNVAIGPNVDIYTTNHHLDGENKFVSDKKPVYIEDNVWIGGRSILLPGIKIGKGSIIGAGSVVTKNTESGHLYAGNPAKLIRKIN